VVCIEGNTGPFAKARMDRLPRGRRAWHAKHSFGASTWEDLPILQNKEYGRRAITK